MSDTKAIRRYQAGIERALALFDATNEWADYIAFLSRLLKSLQGPPEDIDIPLKATIARYLAQCLKPSLPSGVHQKTLEVYDLIFSIIGVQGLSKDLPLYLPGLSHTLSFASLSTRPQLLAIYDRHILTLSAMTLRPALRALILSLLPGVEEETSEDFEQTLSTFNGLREKFAEENQEKLFWQNLFLASITSSNRRAGVLVYLLRYLPRMPSQTLQWNSNGIDGHITAAIRAVITPEPGLLIRCFATGLQDPQPLVQRGFLDLMVSHLPLDACVFAGSAQSGDLDILVDASTTIVLRRDMSLNRRLWAWYTGSETMKTNFEQENELRDNPTSPTGSVHNTSKGAAYFGRYGLASVVRCMSTMIDSSSNDPVQRARPFRIALSLMDRWEIGGPVIESQFVSLFESLQRYQATAPSQEAFDEVYRSANVCFDGIESKVVAGRFLSLIAKRELDTVLFVISNFSLEEEDMARKHAANICVVITKDIIDQLRQSILSGDGENIPCLDKMGHALQNLLLLIPAGMLLVRAKTANYQDDLKDQILRQYVTSDALQNGDLEQSSVPTDLIGSVVVRGVFDCLQECVALLSRRGTLLTDLFASMDQCIVLVQDLSILPTIDFVPVILRVAEASTLDAADRRFQIVTSLTRLVTTLSIRDSSHAILTPMALSRLVPILTRHLWGFLLSSTPQYHVETVEAIWHLHLISRSLRLVESTIIHLVVAELSQPTSVDTCAQKFGALWVHSRLAAKQAHSLMSGSQNDASDDVLDLLQHPLLQVIDFSDTTLTTHSCLQWMTALPSLNPLFAVIFYQMPKDMTDSSSMSIALQRLIKLVSIARSNEAQWKAFSGKSGHRDAVFELCSSLTSNQAVVNSLGVEALKIVRLLIGNEGIELGEDMLKMLSTRLVASYEMETFQNSLLDTLQLAFSTNQKIGQPDWLIPMILEGISSSSIDATLDKWITLLCTVVPLLSASNLLAALLKVTNTLCKRIDLYLMILQNSYRMESDNEDANGNLAEGIATYPERSIFSLLSGMEYILARAHHQASLPRAEQESGRNKTPVDVPSSRSSANDHLTVVLCMQDALKICSKLWMWRSSSKITKTNIDTKSLHYTTTRLRTRSRRILENLVEAEAQECLETLIGIWVDKRLHSAQHGQVLELLQTLDGARPKFMMPATFNAIFNRTNPGALDYSQRSSLSVSVDGNELIAFLNDYTIALEDDLLEEIWTDCTTFLKEVLANPMPYRSILIKLLEFISVLCRKMENTNFGEEVRMRKELADICTRLFTAIFTIKPQGLDGAGSKTSDVLTVFEKKASVPSSPIQKENTLQILRETLPDLSLVLSQSDRLATVYMGIATNITSPLLHSRVYPTNISADLLALLQTMSTTPAATRAWKKDVADAFNDVKFFQNSVEYVALGWLPLIRQLVLADKTMLPDTLARLLPPAVAGLMFGVGASAARIEADKRTQSTLRRIGLLLLAMDVDHFVPHLPLLLTKLEELLTATPESSPSSNSRSEVYLIFRMILLTFSQSQLPALWPIIDNELRELCSAMIDKEFSKFTLAARLQGAKLLDLLLLMKPDEFQLHEWLFVTDTLDAIYPPAGVESIALADKIVLKPSAGQSDAHSFTPGHARKPSLCTDDSRDDQKTESLLAAFFTHLSIRAFEDSYGLRRVDIRACRDDILKDLFTE